jgi:hypothetical protein
MMREGEEEATDALVAAEKDTAEPAGADQAETRVGMPGDQPEARGLRPRNVAGAVVYPQDARRKVFGRGGGRR